MVDLSVTVPTLEELEDIAGRHGLDIPDTELTQYQGGRIVGKATCEDLCFSISSFTSANGPVPNFYDKSRVAGGSSSGCAYLVASGEIDLAVGGDQAGSIRLPSACNGIVGLKPTFGLIPYTGAMSMEASLDHLGPMTATVHDCARLLQVMAGYDNGTDGRQCPHIKVPKYTQMLEGEVRDLRIGVLEEGFDDTDPKITAVVKAAVDKLRDAGATAEDVSIPMHKDGNSVWLGLAVNGKYQTMMDCKGVNIGLKGTLDTPTVDYLVKGVQSRFNDISITLKYLCLLGSYMKGKYANHFYAEFRNLTRVLTKAYDEALSNYDVLVLPTIHCLPPKLPAEDISVKDYLIETTSMLRNCCSFNATGHPALSMNAGFADGLPVGMMMVGKHHDDATVLKVAYAAEQLLKTSSK